MPPGRSTPGNNAHESTLEWLQSRPNLPTESVMEPVAVSAPRAGSARIWSYVALVAILAVALVAGPVASSSIPRLPMATPGWIVALGVYLAEIAVIHIQIRRDTHSFSMSEVPIVIGAFLLDPISLMGAILIGNLVALSVSRRQSPVKLITNLALAVVQAGLIVAIMGRIGGDHALTPQTIAGAIIGALAANLVAHLLIVGAITISGGTEPVRESVFTLGLTSLGSIMNSVLGLFGVSMLAANTGAGWLGLAPPVFLYLAYRGYSIQRIDKERVTKLFEATQALHRTPQVERALEKAGQIALDLVQATGVHILVFGQEKHDIHYLTTVVRDGEATVMRPVILDLGQSPFSDILARLEPSRFSGQVDGMPMISWSHDALAAPLKGEGEHIGVMLATDRIGDVSGFDDRDLQMLSTLGSQLAVSLINGRLVETLAEVRSLQAQLEDLVKSKDQLIASVSHELRTPLTGIIGLAQIMQEITAGSLDPEAADLLGTIVDQGNDLSNIIDDLLAYARTENGSLTVDIKPFDVSNLLIGTLAAGPTSVDVSAVEPAHVLADPMRVKQIVRNLVTNARRYGGERIWLEVTSGREDVSILVCDNGNGIPPSKTDSVFEPYQSAHDQRLQPGSVGLGLALSRKLARLMDGELTYERREGDTVFRLTLNRAPMLAGRT